ncbi:MAG: LLM class flavin-dependent oxidoreductase [Actinomycetota bacterium]
MRFGLALPHYDFSLPGEQPATLARVVEFAQEAERLGYDSLWISDHFFLSLERYGGPLDRQGSLEPMTTLAALAVQTSRVRIGTLVACAPFRHPSILAKMSAALSLYSGGRFDLGLGAGWYEEEFEAFGVPFGTVGERFPVLEETLEAVRLLLRSEGPVTFQGERFELRDALLRPHPGEVPLWLGAKGGPRSLRLAARLADGWNTVWRWTPSAYEERVGELRHVCEESGRDPSTMRLSLGLSTLIGRDDADLRERYERFRSWSPGGGLSDVPLEEFGKDTLTGTPSQVRERIALFEDLGVEEMIVNPGPTPFAFPDPEIVQVFAEEIIGSRAPAA